MSSTQPPARLQQQDDDEEWVLLLPPPLTKNAYKILVASNCVFRSWHLEGRFGSRTHPHHDGDHPSNKRVGIPVLSKEWVMAQAESHTDLRGLLENNGGVEFVFKTIVPSNRAIREPPHIDARIHPERAPSKISDNTRQTLQYAPSPPSSPLFTYVDLFAGIGGFAVALNALGGRCLLASEIDPACQRLYRANFPTHPLLGDIYQIGIDDLPQNGSVDLLVGGFPCQPFSAMGEQPGLACEKGTLFLEIVRLLEACQPRAFLLENVPGLLSMKGTFDVIVQALQGAGYSVTFEVCNARGLTATSRKRLFLVGLLVDDNHIDKDGGADNTNNKATASSDSCFEFPYIPDLQLKARDVIDYTNAELSSMERELLPVTNEQLEILGASKKWKPADLAWPNTVCDTIVSHYGNAVTRGETQLVPCSATRIIGERMGSIGSNGNNKKGTDINHHNVDVHTIPNTNPRRFSPRECLRIMGFPNSYTLLPKKILGSNNNASEKFPAEDSGKAEPQIQQKEYEQSDRAFLKEQYRMVGNAVCPPLIAALAGAVLNRILKAPPPHISSETGAFFQHKNWVEFGRCVAVDLAYKATRTGRPKYHSRQAKDGDAKCTTHADKNNCSRTSTTTRSFDIAMQ